MRRRVLATIVAVTALAVIAFFIPSAIAMRSRIQRGELLELQREASIVASRVPGSGPVDLAALVTGIAPVHDVAFYDGSGALIAGEGPDEPDAFVVAALDGAFAEGYEDGDLVAAVPLRLAPRGPELVVRIREPGSEIGGKIARSIALLALLAVGVIAAATVVGLMLARRLSRPMEDLRRWAARLGDEPSGAPPEPTGIVEVDELGDAMAASSRRVQELLGRERSFSSQVSHQLRTPVAAMRVAIEAELDSPRNDPTEVLTECLGELDRLESTVTSMLALARHDRRATERRDVTALVAEHVQRARGAFEAAGRSVEVRGRPAVWSVDVQALDHIVDVLLHNALVHGRGAVVVQTRATPNEIEIDVQDAGRPPVDADPFSERRSDSGHGIGLRLARTLAESQGGRLGLVDAPTTVFRLTLPAPR